jgi:hypothetical protein
MTCLATSGATSGVKSETELPPPLAEAHAKGRRAVLDELAALLDEGMRTCDFRSGIRAWRLWG